jgi:polyhydroxyalkanoate synthesis regulator phasin
MDDNGSLALDEATKLSQDLIEEETIDAEIHKELSNKTKIKAKSTRKKTKEVKLPCRRSKRLENNH